MCKMASPERQSEAPKAPLDRIRGDHTRLRAVLAGHDGALADLELRGDTRGIRRLALLLRAECDEHFPLEEDRAREVLGPESGPLSLLVDEHRDLRRRVGEIELLLAGAGGGDHDQLWRAWVDLARALSCHICREEHGLLPLLDVVASGAFTRTTTLPRLPCGR
jgi:hypothetical protein